MTTANIVGAAKSAAVMPLGYISRREIQMGSPTYARLQKDLEVDGFGELCGLPVVLNENLGRAVHIVSIMGD
jgi:hypothetical protein